MNCLDFQERMQQLIDDRMDLAIDEELNDHAMFCDSCCAQMQTWQQIESVFTDVDDRLPEFRRLPELTSADRSDQRSPHRLGLSMVAAAAAVFLLVIVSAWFNRDGETTRVALAPTVVQDDEVQVDPARWWQNVQQRDWIGQTMPAVQSVRDGVAPLGRSLIQAVAILTTTGGAQAS